MTDAPRPESVVKMAAYDALSPADRAYVAEAPYGVSFDPGIDMSIIRAWQNKALRERDVAKVGPVPVRPPSRRRRRR